MSKLSRVVHSVIKANASLEPRKQRKAILKKVGVPVRTPDDHLGPTLREAVNEIHRRAALHRRREARKARRQASKFGRRGEPYRRIIHTERRPRYDYILGAWSGEREYHYHATKGWRSYRATT